VIMRIIISVMDNMVKVSGASKGAKAVDANTTLFSVSDSKSAIEIVWRCRF
jgi:hypothetical protein